LSIKSKYKPIIKSIYLTLIFGLAFSKIIAQPFQPGDIIINFNYGAPQITPVILKTAINLYNKNTSSKKYEFNVTNSGVFNAKAEYAMVDNFGLGFASSYWDMRVYLKDNYSGTNPITGLNESFTDKYDLSISALAFGIRGNYHFLDMLKIEKLDPYFGATIGATKYTYGLHFSSNYPDKQAPETYKLFDSGYASRLLKSGWSSYISTTFGIRYFPIKYVGLNLEAGWDRGAFLFGGIAFKFHTKPIKSFQE
jgi:hypothetical protein